jgi:hypothetical protein
MVHWSEAQAWIRRRLRPSSSIKNDHYIDDLSRYGLHFPDSGRASAAG